MQKVTELQLPELRDVHPARLSKDLELTFRDDLSALIESGTFGELKPELECFQ
jgi:hypothetical protein